MLAFFEKNEEQKHPIVNIKVYLKNINEIETISISLLKEDIAPENFGFRRDCESNFPTLPKKGYICYHYTTESIKDWSQFQTLYDTLKAKNYIVYSWNVKQYQEVNSFDKLQKAIISKFEEGNTKKNHKECEPFDIYEAYHLERKGV